MSGGALTLEMLQRAMTQTADASWLTRPSFFVVSTHQLEIAGDLGRHEIAKHLEELAMAAGRAFLGAAIVPHPDRIAAGRWILAGDAWPYPRPRVRLWGTDLDAPHRRYIDDPKTRVPKGESYAGIERAPHSFWRSQV